MNRWYIAAICVLAVLNACGEKKDTKIYFQNNVKVVENVKDEIINIDLPLIDEQIIGNADLDRPFYQIRSIEQDQAGNIYVLDAGNHRFLKIDANKKLIFQKGQRGEGPGEFIDPVRLRLYNEYLYIYDTRLRRMNIYDLSGNLLDSHLFTNYHIRSFDVMREDKLLLSTFEFGVFGDFAVIYDLTSQSGHRIIENLHEITVQMPGRVNIALEAEYRMLNNQHIYFIFPYPYKIAVYDLEGSPVKKILKRDSRINEPEILLFDEGRSISIRERGKLEYGYVYKDRYWVVNCIAWDEKTKSFSQNIDFFTIEGKYLYTQPLKQTEKLINIVNDHFYFTRTFPDEEIVIRKYEIERDKNE